MNPDEKQGVRHWLNAMMLFLALSLCLPCRASCESAPCEGFESIKQELELTKQSLKNYKELYERKDKEINALNEKLNKLQGGFEQFQKISDRLGKEKELLQKQQEQHRCAIKTA